MDVDSIRHALQQPVTWAVIFAVGIAGAFIVGFAKSYRDGGE